MKTQTKILLIVGLSSTIAFFGYKVYKEYKRQMAVLEADALLEELEQSAILVDEDDIEEPLESVLEGSEAILEYNDVVIDEEVVINDAIVVPFDKMMDQRVVENVNGIDIDMDEPSLLEQMLTWSIEELNELRFEGDTNEAWEQYKLFLMANIPLDYHGVRRELEFLHGYSFVFFLKGEYIFRNMFEDREDFFGGRTKYTNQSIENTVYTFAEVVLQLASQLSIDLDQPFVDMVILILDQVGRPDNPNNTVTMLRNNLFTSERKLFGFFGLYIGDSDVDWTTFTVFEQYNIFIYDKIEYGMDCIAGREGAQHDNRA